MNETYDTLNLMLEESEKVRAKLKRESGLMVRNREELNLVKELVHKWVDIARPQIVTTIQVDNLSKLDGVYDDLLRATERQLQRTQYETKLKALKSLILNARTQAISNASLKNAPINTDTSPDFSPLISDASMQEFLRVRWNECEQCVKNHLPLSATVMIGGLLETLLYARAQSEPDKKRIFTANSAPRNKDLTTKGFQEWGLRNYIEVGRELNWISEVAKDISEVLMEYRNYIHPHKQVINNMLIHERDVEIIWEIGKKLAQQVIASAKA